MGSQPGLLAVAREKMRIRHLALRTEQAYLQWLRRYVVFHNRRHPRELGAPEVEQFLTYLAVHRKVSAATQNQALQAAVSLPPRAGDGAAVGGQCHPRLPPEAAPCGVESQYLFPAAVPGSLFPLTGASPPAREDHPARRAGRRAEGRHRPARELSHPASLLRHPSARGWDIRTVQELLGHADLKSTMLYTHVMAKGANGVRSPLDRESGSSGSSGMPTKSHKFHSRRTQKW